MSGLSDNGIYYFIGNTTSHILHALPLHKKLGGVFVVLSEKARKKIADLYDVPVIYIDDVPYQWHRYGYKIKPIHEYGNINKKHHKTISFLNENARVVLFYDLFDFHDTSLKINGPKTVFLTHGNMLKDYMGQNNRVNKLTYYNYMASLGPSLKHKLIEKGVPKEKLIDVGVARTDDVIKHQSKVKVSDQISRMVGSSSASKFIVSYMPTFWGASSIYSTGVGILNNFPSNYTLLFKPHPHTPRKILKEYLKIINRRNNIYYITEDMHKDISIVDIFSASSVIIGDVSSVMLEAILTRKPLIFAYGDDKHTQSNDEYSSIMEIVEFSGKINTNNVDSVEDIIRSSISSGIDSDLWSSTIAENFYDADGTSVNSIVSFVNKIKSN